MSNESANSVLDHLSQNINKLVKLANLSMLIPEVGSNFVYCLPNSKRLAEVAGLTGRIILVRGQPQAVGEVDFGWSPFMGQVVLVAHHIDKNIRSAISLRYSPLIVEACQEIGLDTVEFQLPNNHSDSDCVTITALESLGTVPQALFDKGAVGLEPLVVLFASDPVQIVKWVQKILRKFKTVAREARGK
ncbi:MAG: thiamine-phosphate synthase family protein [Promethearchaeota archaeon]